MFLGYLVFTYFVVRVYSMETDECNFVCDTEGCKEIDEYPLTSSCPFDNILNDVNFALISDNNIFSPFATLQINLTLPRIVHECGVTLTLFVNESVKEENCMNYNFRNVHETEIHTKHTICFIPGNNQFQNSIHIPVEYIFTACYTVEIYFGSGRYVRNNKFLRTNHNRTEIVKPKVDCKYEVVPDDTKNKTVYFEVDFSTTVVKQAILALGTTYEYNKKQQCNYRNLDKNWSFNVSEEYTKNINNYNTTMITNKFEEKINFTIHTLQDTNYCIVVILRDNRCNKNNLQNSNPYCAGFKVCQIRNTNVGVSFDSDNNFYIFLWIVIVLFIAFAMLVIIYLGCIVYTVGIQQNKFNTSKNSIVKSNRKKYNKIKILKNKEMTSFKSICTVKTDIILLYPKSSESVMALMAEFRGILSKACQCHVHDWHNGTEWNRVAEIGAYDWFAAMLNKGCRVIWIDTPTMRSLIKRRFKTDFFSSSDQFDLTQIGDFRDIALPVIYNLAKQDIEKSALQQQRHFVVNCENDNLFVDLSPHMRYVIPQDLNLLCSVFGRFKNLNYQAINVSRCQRVVCFRSTSNSDETKLAYIKQGEEDTKRHLYDLIFMATRIVACYWFFNH
ncbi:uncharacterized protein LOC143186275 [Calliopsis andreniformis]|uniref:uncharacterized protein LOC143186275 n=1 Tax=Calliopsis andreniformis TaxID=337506 RepID=UPI003FCD7FB0